MGPDFYRQYQDLSVRELVKVARTPADYLPEAVAAAQRILREKGVTKEEMDAAEWTIAQKEMEDAAERSEQLGIREWMGELFGRERLTMPSERWLSVLLVLYGLWYSYNIFIILRQMVWLSRCPDCMPDDHRASFIAWDLGIAAYMTICLYCLLKQRRIGWSLLFIEVIFRVATKSSVLFRLYAHHATLFNPFSTFVIPILINIGLGAILWRPYVLTTFNINAATKSRTLLVAALVGVVAMVIA